MASPATSVKQNAKTSRKIPDSLLADESIKWQLKVPVGIKFNPNDQVLAGYYLAGKVNGCTDGPIFPLIKEVDVFQYEPSQLPKLSYDFGQEKMYFFSRLKKTSEKEMNVGRRVPGGVWKKTGEPRCVVDKDRNPIATKTTLAYYKDEQISKKTQWLMKEYMLLNKESWKLCVVCYSRNHSEINNIGCYYSSEDSTSDDLSSSDSEKQDQDEIMQDDEPEGSDRTRPIKSPKA